MVERARPRARVDQGTVFECEFENGPQSFSIAAANKILYPNRLPTHVNVQALVKMSKSRLTSRRHRLAAVTNAQPCNERLIIAVIFDDSRPRHSFCCILRAEPIPKRPVVVFRRRHPPSPPAPAVAVQSPCVRHAGAFLHSGKAEKKAPAQKRKQQQPRRYAKSQTCCGRYETKKTGKSKNRVIRPRNALAIRVQGSSANCGSETCRARLTPRPFVAKQHGRNRRTTWPRPQVAGASFFSTTKANCFLAKSPSLMIGLSLACGVCFRGMALLDFRPDQLNHSRNHLRKPTQDWFHHPS
jgi:hypothetical protein